MKRFGYAVRAAAFGLVLVLVLHVCSLLLTPKYYLEDIYPTTSTFREFYQLEKNSADVLFLGSSHAVTAFNPSVLYENWGILSYNLGSEQQNMLTSYYWLKEALRTQSPKVVVLDTYFLFPYNENSPFNSDEAYIRKALDFMRPSPVRWEALRDIAGVDPSQSIASYVFPGARYHERLHTLTQKDYELRRLYETEGLMGYGILLWESANERYEPFDLYDSTEPAEMVPLMAGYLDRMLALCRENGAELLLVKTPAVGQTMEKSRATQLYADEHGLTFVDFNDSLVYYSELDYNFYSENGDSEHANVWGAQKITDYLGGVITDLVDLPEREHPDWDALLERHEAQRGDLW